MMLRISGCISQDLVDDCLLTCFVDAHSESNGGDNDADLRPHERVLNLLLIFDAHSSVEELRRVAFLREIFS